MDGKFHSQIYDGEFGPMRLMRTALAEGEFWLRDPCEAVYRGQDGDIDYDEPQAVCEAGATAITVLHQDLPADTIWHYVRRGISGCGIEGESSKPAIVRIDGEGDALTAAPNPPVNLTVMAQAGGTFRLRWRYVTVRQAVWPTAFRVYVDTGSGFDFSGDPEATVTPNSDMVRIGTGMHAIEWTSGAYDDGATVRFCVRSYSSVTEGESQNAAGVAGRADTSGPEGTVSLAASWQEI